MMTVKGQLDMLFFNPFYLFLLSFFFFIIRQGHEKVVALEIRGLFVMTSERFQPCVSDFVLSKGVRSFTLKRTECEHNMSYLA